MKILEFRSLSDAGKAVVIIDQLAEAYFIKQGYSVIDHGNGRAVVGKNASTGAENLSALTTIWAIPVKSPDKTYYFKSLTGTRYEGGMDQLKAGLSDLGVGFTEKDFPDAWVPTDINAGSGLVSKVVKFIGGLLG